MNTFKHSGALGDLVYSLALVRHFGGGEFYLHLNQIDWIGKHYYNSPPAGFHQGRMTQADFEYMRPFMESLDYITKFDVLDPAQTCISHNLDRFRVPFVGHPGNYLDIYSDVFGLTPADKERVALEPWLTAEPADLGGRTIVVNRTRRWVQEPIPEQWAMMREQGVEEQAIFVGLPDEYERFLKISGWNIPHYPTANMLELAQAIAAADVFIGNQSQAYALAVGLGVEEIWLETRQDLPRERNECYFPKRAQINYF